MASTIEWLPGAPVGYPGARQLVGCPLDDTHFAVAWIEWSQTEGREMAVLYASIATVAGDTISLGTPILVQDQVQPADLNIVRGPINPRISQIDSTRFLLCWQLTWQNSNYWFAHKGPGFWTGEQPDDTYAVVGDSSGAMGTPLELSEFDASDPSFPGSHSSGGPVPVCLTSTRAIITRGDIWGHPGQTVVDDVAISGLGLSVSAEAASELLQNTWRVRNGPTSFWAQGSHSTIVDLWTASGATLTRTAGMAVPADMDQVEAMSFDPSVPGLLVVYRIFTGDVTHYAWFTDSSATAPVVEVARTGEGRIGYRDVPVNAEGVDLQPRWQGGSGSSAVVANAYDWPSIRSGGITDFNEAAGVIPPSELPAGAWTTLDVVAVPIGGTNRFGVVVSYETAAFGDWALRPGIAVVHFEPPPSEAGWSFGQIGF